MERGRARKREGKRKGRETNERKQKRGGEKRGRDGNQRREREREREREKGTARQEESEQRHLSDTGVIDSFLFDCVTSNLVLCIAS